MSILEEKSNISYPKKRLSYTWLVVFSSFAVIGAISWSIQLTQGLQMTNLTTQNMWGLYIIGFMIFTGVAAGSLFFTSIPYLFGLEEFKDYTRISAYLATISSTVAASLFIIVDIGSPARAWLFITSGNFTSPMFWDFIVLVSYMVISLIFTYQLTLVHKGKKSEKTVIPISIAAFIAGIAVIITSFVFSFQVSRPLWNTPMQPLSFLVSALLVALSVLILLGVILNKRGYIKLSQTSLIKMGKVAATLLVFELLIVSTEVAMGLYPGAGGEYEIFTWLVSGDGAIGFWLQIAMIITGIFLLGTKLGQQNVKGILAGAIFAIGAVYLLKSNLLQAEFAHSLLSFPGPEVYGDNKGYYMPSLLEVGLSVGIVSLGALLLQLGLYKYDLGTTKSETMKFKG